MLGNVMASKFHKNFVRLIVFLSISFLLSSCNEIETFHATKNDTIEVSRTFDFFFANDDETYLVISNENLDEAKSIILKSYSWVIPDGFEIEESYLDIVPKTVEWGTEESSTTVEHGLGLVVKATIRVKDNANTGTQEFSINMPGLGLISSKTETTPTFPKKGIFVPESEIRLIKINVHDTGFGKFIFVSGQFIGKTWFIPLIIFGIIAFLEPVFEKIKKILNAPKKRKLKKIFSPILTSSNLKPISMDDITRSLSNLKISKQDTPKIVIVEDAHLTLQGKILAITTGKEIDDLHLALPKSLRAKKSNEVKNILILSRADFPHGKYKSGKEAFIRLCIGKIVNLDTYAMTTFISIGSFPPDELPEYYLGSKVYGDSPDKKIIQYLLSISKKQ